MKKILSLFFLMLFMGCITCYSANAATIFVTDEDAQGEKEISVNVQITGNSNACGGKVDLSYDEKLLKAESYQVGDLLLNSACMVNLNYTENVIRISWAGTEELTDSGVLCNIRFSVLANESFSSAVQIKQAKIADVNGEPIEVETGDCSIEYTKKSASSSRGSGSLKPVRTEVKEPEVSEVKNMSFSDINDKDWFYESVKYAYENDLMKGVSETEFAPQSNVTRAMFVTILYRMEKEPESVGHGFQDVKKGSWYDKAVGWAAVNGIVSGISPTEFAPDLSVTREQMATIIYNFAKYKNQNITTEENTAILSYDDYDSISLYAKEAFGYVFSKGIILGTTETTLAPKENATRAQAAAIFMRIDKLIK